MNLALVVAVVAVMSTTQLKCGHKHFNIKNKWRPTLFPPPSSFASKRKGHFCGKAKPKTKSQNRFLITRRPFLAGIKNIIPSVVTDYKRFMCLRYFLMLSLMYLLLLVLLLLLSLCDAFHFFTIHSNAKIEISTK